MAARRSKRTASKSQESKKTSEEKENRVKIKSIPVIPRAETPVESGIDEEEVEDPREPEETEGLPELPFMDIPALPAVVRRQRPEKGRDPNKEVVPREPGFKNRAPLQADERAKELLDSTLQQPITLTTLDLLNVSDPVRQELKKLLTKKRTENKPIVSTARKTEIKESSRDPERPESQILIHQLPEATVEILSEDRDGLKKGDIVIGDPVLQYLATVPMGEAPRTIVAARESGELRAIYPTINSVGEVESLLDSGSQIISMAEDVARQLEITWDVRITIDMESANRTLERTLGLARNVPFTCGPILVYLQVHILTRPAYRILLGRPFDIITESLVKNERNGDQTLTLTDPNSGETCTMPTYERGKPPIVIKKPIKQDFRSASMN